MAVRHERPGRGVQLKRACGLTEGDHCQALVIPEAGVACISEMLPEVAGQARKPIPAMRRLGRRLWQHDAARNGGETNTTPRPEYGRRLDQHPEEVPGRDHKSDSSTLHGVYRYGWRLDRPGFDGHPRMRSGGGGQAGTGRVQYAVLHQGSAHGGKRVPGSSWRPMARWISAWPKHGHICWGALEGTGPDL